MALMIFGLIFWSIVHFIPVALPNLRNELMGKLGQGPYKAGFAIVIVLSVFMMVMGFRSFEDNIVLFDFYDLAIVPALLLMILAFILMASSVIKNNLGNAVRHPQLIGFAIWSFCHVLINGDLRATILFGTLFIWSVLTVIMINKRDGEYKKPAPVLPHQTISAAAAGLVVFIAAVWGHEYIAGINLMGQAVAQ